MTLVLFAASLFIMFDGLVPDFERAVCAVTGCSDIALVDTETYDRLRTFSDKPLEVNSSTRARLVESGLFSHYQIESILDRRSRLGDILSLEELSTVDGFTPVSTECLAPFLSFSPSAGDPGAVFLRPGVEACAGGNFKYSPGEAQGQYMTRVDVSSGRFDAAVAAKSPWAETLAHPETPGWSIQYEGKAVSRVVLGNFYARFGQGLAQWSGTQMGSVSTPSSLMKHPMGITRYRSWSPSYALLGAAVTFETGPVVVNSFVDVGSYSAPVFSAGANVSYHFRDAQAGVTAVVPFHNGASGSRISADFQYTLKGTVLFGELCWTFGNASFKGNQFWACADSSATVLFGVRFPIGGADCSVRVTDSMYERNAVAAVAMAPFGSRHSFDIYSSFSYYPRAKGQTPSGKAQIKGQMNYSFKPVDALEFSFRADMRIRPWGDGNRFEFRQDAGYAPGKWIFSQRMDVSRCREWGFLGCVEAGYKDRYEGYLQFGMFRIDEWADRIYVYQRDVPFSFNVPAMYGRGLWMSAYGVLRPLEWMKIYLHSAVTAYPMARKGDTRKETSVSAKLQLVFDF